ncbi:LLM class flavin-dependent oxidoreductase [Aldersonia sp. NBC_00410]|uniref:LLM class flavin-dependent oxidoreductase n=1 Tax=Aldersonia sp. NBC_00410 TaxID=2975954 RepID=UPI00225983CB|nr:LLM class flavin-dependent oxidoreductase [Aldersonia sp. NBC_00410]MCX5041988.1 LLM class flavin-dependent oxidoreductase [Aldersonia sp. NBC_00410]
MSRQPVLGIDLDTAVVADILDPDGALPAAEFGALLDASGVDFVVLGGDLVDADATTSGATLDSSVAAAILATHTRGVGLVVAAAPGRQHPYNLARRLASLDHLGRGRTGWLAGTESLRGAAGSAVAANADATADAILVARKLWESWPADSIVADHERSVFTESERITHIDHEGVYSVSGPLNVPAPPQGHPPVFWRPRGEAEFVAAQNFADVLIVPAHRVGAAADIATALADAEWSGSRSVFDDIPLAAAGIVVRVRAAVDLPAVLAATVHLHRESPAATLRERLSLPAPDSVLHGYVRSLFPVS